MYKRSEIKKIKTNESVTIPYSLNNFPANI